MAGGLRRELKKRRPFASLAEEAFLNLFRLDREGNGNQYYTATVYSMLQNWHAFFFASFDPGGYVTVDKPPLGFWIQAAVARLLGVVGVEFSGWSVLLPEALAGVASVALLYVLVGVATGLAAAMLVARTGTGTAQHGYLWELDAIAAVVIGGTLLTGGRGTIVGTVLGVLIFNTLTNVFILNDLDTSNQAVAKGLIIVAAVLLQQRLAGRSSGVT